MYVSWVPRVRDAFRQIGNPYPDQGRLWVCFIDDRGDNSETVQTTLQCKEEIGVGAC